MFGFIKKLKTVYEIEPLSIRERALKAFSRIEGLDDIKEMMLRALESSERAHTISTWIIKKLPQNAVIQIASSVWKTGSRDIRDVLKVAKLCNPLDTEEDISRLISIHHKYRKTGKECNN